MVSRQPTLLQAVSPNEFLPPISRWSRVGGLALVALFGGTIALSALLKYNVTVKAPAVVRPKGDLRIVEATTTGRVQEILVAANDAVVRGEPIALLHDAEVRSRQQHLQTELTQLQRQREQIQQELLALDRQMQAETQAREGAIAAAQAELALRQQAFRDEQITTTADLREAEAAVLFAQEEFNRYQQLAETGALADLQIQEKSAALETALARLERARGLINPSNAAIAQAQENLHQTQGREDANLARLQQTQESLRRQQTELDQQRQTQQQALQQVRFELEQLTIRAPISGIIQSLTLRNPNQVTEEGEAIAHIAPNTTDLIVQAQVNQADINRIDIGQSVNVRIDSCPYTDYGLLPGQVATISPDAQPLEGGQAETAAFYRVEIVPEGRSLQSANLTCLLQSGMRGRADIITQRESVFVTLARKLRVTIEQN